MVASRRPQILAESSGTIGLAVRRWRRQTEAVDFGMSTAALMRWHVTVLPSAPPVVLGVNRARRHVELIRSRAGESAEFELKRAMLQVIRSSFRLGRPTRSEGCWATPRRRVSDRLSLVGATADAAAQVASLRVGMPAIKAQALAKNLIIRNAEPEADIVPSSSACVVGAAICADRGRRSACQRRHRSFGAAHLHAAKTQCSPTCNG